MRAVYHGSGDTETRIPGPLATKTFNPKQVTKIKQVLILFVLYWEKMSDSVLAVDTTSMLHDYSKLWVVKVKGNHCRISEIHQYQTLIPPEFKSHGYLDYFLSSVLFPMLKGFIQTLLKSPRSFPNEPRQNAIEWEIKRARHFLNIERVINLLIYIFIIYKQENS